MIRPCKSIPAKPKFEIHFCFPLYLIILFYISRQFSPLNQLHDSIQLFKILFPLYLKGFLNIKSYTLHIIKIQNKFI